MFRRNHAPPVLLSFVALCAAVGGCQLGPHALRGSHLRYNKAMQATVAEQLLLNLVRLRYRESPVFLDVGSISAQFVFQQSADATGTLNEDVGAQRGNPGVLRFGGGFGYAERPTITYSPLSGEAFVQRMLAPIGVDTIILLTNSGWRIDRVIRLAVQEANGLDNARMASGPTPALAPSYKGFVRMCSLLARLQSRRQIYLEYDGRPAALSGPIPVNQTDGKALVEASKAGVRFAMSPNGTEYVLTRTKKVPVIRFANGAAEAEETAELLSLLELPAEAEQYDLASALGNGGGGRDGQGNRTEISLNTRSLMGIMFFLSQVVEAPPEHRRAHLVTETLDAAGNPFDWALVLGDLFRIRSCRFRPSGAAVAIEHRDRWFYIADDDLSTKSTFSLLQQLFTLQAGGAAAAGPVLTLPVG